MSQLLAANNASTNIVGPISNTALSVGVTAGTGAEFPAPGANQYFVATFTDAATGLIHEIVWATNNTSDTMTIVRAQEGTSALPWSAGDLFANLVTAGTMELMTQPYQLQAQAGNYAVDSGTANALVATLSPAPTALSAIYGTRITIDKSAAANTGDATLALNGFGALHITHADGTVMGNGELPASAPFTIVPVSGAFILQSVGQAPVLAPTFQAKTTNYSAAAGDKGSTLRFSLGGSGATLTLPNPATVGANWYINVIVGANDGIALAFTPAAGNIDGIATRSGYRGTTVTIYTDGTNYFTSAGRYEFVSAQISGWSVSSVTTPVAHALGVAPREAFVELICTSAELNFSIGDIYCVPISYAGTAGGTPTGVALWFNATNIGASILQAIYIVNKTSGASTGNAVTPANWNIRFVGRAMAPS
jgi:hypothetical protein